MNSFLCPICGQEDPSQTKHTVRVEGERDIYREALQYVLETNPKCRRKVNGYGDPCRAWAYEDLEHCPRCVAEEALYRLDEKKAKPKRKP